MGSQADYVRREPGHVLALVGVLYAVFLVLQVGGYYLGFWLNREDRLAASVAKVIMNNALGIVIAQKFFGPEVTLFLVLSEIPWSTVTVGYRWYRRRGLLSSVPPPAPPDSGSGPAP